MVTKASTAKRASYKRSHNGHAKKIKSDAEELLQHALEEVRSRSEDVRGQVSEYVREKPFKALGIAVAVGAVLALILKR